MKISGWFTQTLESNPRSVINESKTFYKPRASYAFTGIGIAIAVGGMFRLGSDILKQSQRISSGATLAARVIPYLKAATGPVLIVLGGLALSYVALTNLKKLNAFIAPRQSIPDNVAPDLASAKATFNHPSTGSGPGIGYYDNGQLMTLPVPETPLFDSGDGFPEPIVVNICPSVTYRAPNELINGKRWEEYLPYKDALIIFCLESPRENHWMEVLRGGEVVYMLQTKQSEERTRGEIAHGMDVSDYKWSRVINIISEKPADDKLEYKSYCNYRENKYPYFLDNDGRKILANADVAKEILKSKEPGAFILTRYYSHNQKEYINGYYAKTGKDVTGKDVFVMKPGYPTREGRELTSCDYKDSEIVEALQNLHNDRKVTIKQ